MIKFLALTGVIGVLAVPGRAEEKCAEGHDHAHAPLGSGGGLFEPFAHIHFSSLGTPIVHSFGVEPAFTGRDLFFDYRYRDGEGFTENELELELEWAFTRRLGVIFELPYVFEDESGEAARDGFGDGAIVPRVVLLERERFILTSQVEIVVPTGTDGFGGDFAMAPGVACWLDLGNWWTVNTQVAVEHAFEADESEFLFGLGLVKTLGRETGLTQDHGHGHGTGAGMLHLHAEVTGAVGLSGEEEGAITLEGLLGVTYGVSEATDVRVGVEFPLTSPKEFDGGVVAGVVWHF